MKEKKTEEKQVVDSNEKFFWIIGIAVIVFMILLLGSIWGLKITRDGLNDVNDKLDGLESGNSSGNGLYTVHADGTKTNQSLMGEEYIVGGVKFSNFVITERDGVSTVNASFVNTTEETISSSSFLVRLFDEDGAIIREYSITTTDLVPNPEIIPEITTTIIGDCSNTAKIAVELIK